MEVWRSRRLHHCCYSFPCKRLAPEANMRSKQFLFEVRVYETGSISVLTSNFKRLNVWRAGQSIFRSEPECLHNCDSIRRGPQQGTSESHRASWQSLRPSIARLLLHLEFIYPVLGCWRYRGPEAAREGRARVPRS